jgi:hypothetical protein
MAAIALKTVTAQMMKKATVITSKAQKEKAPNALSLPGAGWQVQYPRISKRRGGEIRQNCYSAYR